MNGTVAFMKFNVNRPLASPVELYTPDPPSSGLFSLDGWGVLGKRKLKCAFRASREIKRKLTRLSQARKYVYTL